MMNKILYNFTPHLNRYATQAIINTRSLGLEVAISLWDWDPNIPGVETDDLLGR